MEMVSNRNLLSHTYDQAIFEKLVPIIQHQYIKQFELLIQTLVQ